MLNTNQEYLDVIKFPGKYNLVNTDKWREKAIYFDKHGYYCPYPENTRDYIDFWDAEKEKILNGVVIDGFYIPGYYYFYLNFLQIYIKQENRMGFPTVYDMDYHTFLCLEHCVFLKKHFGVVKKRQAGFSLKLMVPLIVELWFSKGSPNYFATYEEAQLIKGWTEILETYKNHLNTHTAWYRNFSPDKIFNWRTAKENMDNGRKIFTGRFNTLKGLVLSKSASKGVGGGAKYIFADESGVNPVLDKFLGYVKPMVKYGEVITGTIIVSGAVGELTHSKPLQNIIENPEAHDFYYVENVWDEKRKGTKCGFFVPASWALYGEDENGVPFIDEHGNSDVERSEEYLLRKREKLKKQSIDSYLFAISQDPLTIEECFQFREESTFPLELINQQNSILELKEHDGIFVSLYRNYEGKVCHKVLSDGKYVKDFPVTSKSDKEGNIQIFEFPKEKEPPYGLYWAGVDIVRENESKSSPSLNCVYIFKAENGLKEELVSNQMVAVYTSRTKDRLDWFEEVLLLLEMYNAEALVENNVYWFIEEAIKAKKQRYIAKTPNWIKEIVKNSTTSKHYGVNMSTNLMNELLDKVITYLKEPYYTIFNDVTGEPEQHFGVERIKDRMLLKEMASYRPKSVDPSGNYDRIIAFGLALLHADYNVTRGIIAEDVDYSLSSKDLKKLKANLRAGFTKKIRYGYI